eukprot:239743_1
MAARDQYPADGPIDGGTTIQATKVNYEYTPQQPAEPRTAEQHQIPNLDNATCCGCFDIRCGIIALGVWLLIEAILEYVYWATYENDLYDDNNYKYAVAALCISITFNLIGSGFGIYAGYYYSKKLTSAFFIWGVVRCVIAAFNVIFGLIYLFILALWIYWT